MGDKRENLKKTLGIPEYPWSSDDEGNTSPSLSLPLPSSQLQQTSCPLNIASPGTSGQPSTQPRRSQVTKTERNLFWSLLCSSDRGQVDMISSSRSTEGQRRESTRATNVRRQQEGLLPRTSPLREIRDFLERKKATRSLSHRAGHVVPRSMAGRTMPTKNPLFTSAAASATSSNQRADRRKAGRQLASWIPTTYELQHIQHIATTRQNFKTPECLRTSTSHPSPSHEAPVDDDQPSSSNTTLRTASVGDDAVDADPDHNVTTIVEDSDEVEECPQQPTRTESDLSAPGTTNVAEFQDVSIELAHVVPVFPPAEHSTSADLSDTLQGESDPAPAENAEGQVAATVEEQNERRGIKRKTDGNEDLQEFNQSLLRLLECPVCLEWMAPPMSQCRRGHLVCVSCRARLSACPVCRTAFSSVRNRAMESVAEVLRYPCRHGCGREVRLRRRGGHEASCVRRRYPCPAPACASRAPLDHASLDQHLQAKHLPMLKIGKKHRFSIKVNAEQHDNWVILALREIFHLRIDVDIRTWGVTIYVAYIGPKNNAKTYTYEVAVVGKHNSRSLVYTRATHSDLESASLNVSRQDCFHLSLDQALNFLRLKYRHSETDNSLSVSIAISKNDTEVGKEEDSCDS